MCTRVRPSRCDRLDYFGQTVNIAARVQHLADADEIHVSESVYEAEGVKAQLATLAVDSIMTKLKGIQQDMRVYRIAAPLGRV